MNRKVLIFVLATLTSNIVKKNFLCYSCLNPCYETWIGPNVFSIAATIFFASLALPPTNDNDTPAVSLFLYYTVTSLLVSILALQLIWVPVVEAVTELNTILSKTMLYMNRYLYKKGSNSFVRQVGLFLGTKTATVWSTNFLAVVFLYIVSTDLLKFISLYFYCMPGRGIFTTVRSKASKFVKPCPTS